MAIKVRDYEVRLTRTKEERKLVRQLRYKVFVEEDGAVPTEEQKQLREEYDTYDRFADYMGVFHEGRIVGTYRIIDREAAEKLGGFYTESEYDLTKIKRVYGNIAEMSRACVDPEYRENALVMRMLWAGLGEYILKNQIKIIFGVASFIGTDPADFAREISYLYYYHRSPLALRATVREDLMGESVDRRLSQMDIMPRVFLNPAKIKPMLPPLVKGYMRLGATFGKGVFIDQPFNTVDVFVMLESKNIDRAYQKHFVGSETAFDHLGVPASAFKTFGKIMSLPFKGLAAAAKFFLRDDADDAELVDEDKKEEE
ncbi:ornithine-acyl ACP N-acyltransferase [Bacteroidia bacterium]|nr:ornithine-acyl ACP N-acyltransferase [Bacteroidia bacterium]